jgi:transporter family protein
MTSWFIHAIIAFFLFGLWGFFPKLATNYIHPKSALAYEVLGGIVIAILILYLLKFRPEFDIRGLLFATLAGMAGTLGVLFFLFAVSQGKTSTVVTLTALYPLVTILLAFFILKEPITLKQGVGMMFALVAMILFSV